MGSEPSAPQRLKVFQRSNVLFRCACHKLWVLCSIGVFIEVFASRPDRSPGEGSDSWLVTAEARCSPLSQRSPLKLAPSGHASFRENHNGRSRWTRVGGLTLKSFPAVRRRVRLPWPIAGDRPGGSAWSCRFHDRRAPEPPCRGQP